VKWGQHAALGYCGCRCRRRSRSSRRRVGAAERLDIYNGGSKPVDVIVDLNGTYFVYPAN
jgi:hypothetical protein